MIFICILLIVIERMEEWIKFNDEWIGRVGWFLLVNIVIKNKMLYDDFFFLYLEEIKENIYNEKNRKKEVMNSVLIVIGICNEDLE